jgi:cyclopropane fatty-acyl-phospholipid synthase-like methyltransferase
MVPELEKQQNFDFFSEKYARPLTRTARQVERTVLGHEVGLNGYTTVEQAQALCDVLRLSPTDLLLDVGGGRGWPGLHLAQESGCRLTSTDIPLEALREAKAKIEERELRDKTDVVAADGRALPFRSRFFDAIVHADVFC